MQVPELHFFFQYKHGFDLLIRILKSRNCSVVHNSNVMSSTMSGLLEIQLHYTALTPSWFIVYRSLTWESNMQLKMLSALHTNECAVHVYSAKSSITTTVNYSVFNCCVRKVLWLNVTQKSIIKMINNHHSIVFNEF